MSTVRTGPVIGLLAQIGVLAVLAQTVGLGPVGWTAGLVYGVVLCALLSRGMSRAGAPDLSPADRVTLSRAILVGGVTALAADSFTRPAPVTLMVVLTSVALALDAVDGYTARRTGTSSELGARFDMEIDSFLVLVLCLYVTPSTGAWVLAIGAMRYVFVAASWVLDWMRGSLPPRYWRKVVAAVQGVVLTVAMGDALPGPLTTVVLVASLALLVESFGRDVRWLWTTRHLRRALVHDAVDQLAGVAHGSNAMAHAGNQPSHSAPSAGAGLAGLGHGRTDVRPWPEHRPVAVARRGTARV
ncbi:phosphatidylglycerophosphate synthase [Micromonospora jinlongensis]|uniref:Phosphatidylglycerophosphate synthase n=1 Tax=Micromonospora jinlongensis TaxID=1287877 RepID=A0A7Y9WZX9_9ACTN|nr:phosphatidylglycerophosphate synthase [Micromonospora jinlongensis]